MTSPSIDKISETLNEIFPDHKLEVDETLEKIKILTIVRSLQKENEKLKDQIEVIKQVLVFTNSFDKELSELIEKI